MALWESLGSQSMRLIRLCSGGEIGWASLEDDGLYWLEGNGVDPNDLTICTWLNGEVRQGSSTSR